MEDRFADLRVKEEAAHKLLDQRREEVKQAEARKNDAWNEWMKANKALTEAQVRYAASKEP